MTGLGFAFVWTKPCRSASVSCPAWSGAPPPPPPPAGGQVPTAIWNVRPARAVSADPGIENPPPPDLTGAPVRSGGGGFSIPGSALTARAGRTFQIAVGTWPPAGGGGGGGAPDQAGQLTLADLQGFVQTNANLNPVIGYYKSRFEARVSARPAVIPDYLLAAAETFKRTVGALGDKDELKSWKQQNGR